MNTKLFNLALMVLWLVLCLGLLGRDWWMPDELRERVSGPQTPLVIAVAGLLAVWNFARFFIAYRFGTPSAPSPEVEEYRRKIRALSGHDPRVVNPEFDFDDPPADDPRRDEPPA